MSRATDPRGQPTRKLTAERLALEAGTDPEYVRRLIDAGAVHPDADGLLDVDDVPRVRFARVLAEGGVDVDGLMWAIRSGMLPLDRFPEMWSAPASGPALRQAAQRSQS